MCNVFLETKLNNPCASKPFGSYAICKVVKVSLKVLTLIGFSFVQTCVFFQVEFKLTYNTHDLYWRASSALCQKSLVLVVLSFHVISSTPKLSNVNIFSMVDVTVTGIRFESKSYVKKNVNQTKVKSYCHFIICKSVLI